MNETTCKTCGRELRGVADFMLCREHHVAEIGKLRAALEETRTKMRKKCYCHETGGGTIKCEFHAELIPPISTALGTT